MDKKNIRNFSIIAHIDHGKSTLSDRLIEITETVSKREMKNQLLDSMELERERGITIKLNAVQLKFKRNNQDYTFHLIDTPGHVDFTYEVSRSLAACEAALLVVDATQGVQAQTLSNVYLALENNLEIIPVINKVDLPSADVERVKREIETKIGIDCSDVPLISAKTGLNIDQVLDAIIKKVPSPKNANDNDPLKALIFDSYYDPHKGVVCFIRIFDGKLKVGDEILFMANNVKYIVTEVGIKNPNMQSRAYLEAGEVGYVTASIKTIRDVHVGDTITNANNPCDKPLAGYRKVSPMVYAGLYPVDTADYQNLKVAMEKIVLTDAALEYEYETSNALGFGVRCGFLGLLHMDVIRERIVREYNIPLILLAPSVMYKCYLTDGQELKVDNPANMPERNRIKSMLEPYVKLSISTPDEFIGPIMELCQNFRGEYMELSEIDSSRKVLVYEIPLAEIIYSFFDKLKSVTKGYASLDYELIGYRDSNLVKVDILLNGQKVDALSFISHTQFVYQKAKKIVEKLKTLIPRHLFEIPIQAAVGSKIISRETIKAMRKNVLAKCYGGDVSRKKKLLEQQKEGKKRLKAIGSVQIPQETFSKLLQDDE
ncbi:GTP-binding protein lepA [Mycoplasmoides gallisepticum CA06_2006.052-5-2P]|uniref:Elongation factor 4 n=1 Tax=Mycoplasmoides gallisepticum WI01_2001.043-13-2P TaxID=1159201 RepID=J3YHC8_MYCGL|nr:translation elongation factor 4 [Mycoplasmoides gallisepticum]AFP76123.1 GTP-binding protein lepA [Mycoplasmoides gallisepticum VA94_7994-1-7P]AFP76890.1 GTP-binding protein lepA [Mycoplasmoides gallisepticum NC95_13295-2-2P]AFP77648.1 GTP-binding protein lepA [Mycoplasmoides gallisepticum NC96_1596-4-2P]AFP78415.1 GTP-binding protein lepA [Mycoplasmoides gallisepticum NY01_2001.047-5-1P]AFP79175.1 GTP-binding protein lepA [Mycoplasmoides gallisepticum WI01_2001.043-13-2P]